MRNFPKYPRRTKAKRNFAPLYIVDTVGVSHKLDNHEIGKYIQLGREENMANVATTTRPPATPDEIWEILRETASRQREHEEYWAELRKERKEEAEREALREAARREEWAELKELFADTRKFVEKNSAEMSKLGHSFGDIVEHLVAPGIEERFEEIGLNLKIPTPPASRKIKENGNVIAEVDLQLENAESVMIVEVKAKVRLGDVSDHVSRLDKLRGWYDRRNDGRKLYGAIAGAVFGLAERRAARKAGFFVMVQSGDTMEMDVPEGFKPKEW